MLNPVWRSSKSLCLVAAECRQQEAKWQKRVLLPRDARPQTSTGKTSLTSRESREYPLWGGSSPTHDRGQKQQVFQYGCRLEWERDYRETNTTMPRKYFIWLKENASLQTVIPTVLQWSPRELSEEHVSRIHFQYSAQSARKRLLSWYLPKRFSSKTSVNQIPWQDFIQDKNSLDKNTGFTEWTR